MRVMKDIKQIADFSHRKNKRLFFAFLSLIMTLGVFSTNALAANITVDNNGDGNVGCTLRAAVTSFNMNTLAAACRQTGDAFGINDQISFSVSAVNLSNGEIDIDKTITIDGGSAGVVINSDGSSRIFLLDKFSTHITLKKLTLSGGSADNGGAMSTSRVTLTLNESMTTGNTASSKGGAIYAFGSTVNLNGSIVSDNFSKQGGGIYAQSSTVNLDNSAIMKNTADFVNNDGRGGGLWLEVSNLNLQSSQISNNEAGLEGGGVIAFNNSNITLDDSVMSGNKAQVGGAISTLSNVAVTLNNSTISNNRVERTNGRNVGTAAGMMIIRSKLILNNSTISGNIAQDVGAAMVINSGELTSNNSTIANNISGGSAPSSLFVRDTSTVTLNNTIIANTKTQRDVPVIDCRTFGNPSVVMADAYNIIEQDDCGTAALNIDPDLAPLAFNGGQTKNHGLYTGSLAIDAGDDAKCMDVDTINNLDQRKNIRPEGSHCDIGSFEGMIERTGFFVIPTKNGKTAIINL